MDQKLSELKLSREVKADEKGNSSSPQELFNVIISMQISDPSGSEVDSKRIDFGKLKSDQVRGLADFFSMIASNIEYIKKLEPQYERLDKSKPVYLR